MSTPALRYRAFISYSHRDSKAAHRLHRALESFRVPKALQGERDGGRTVPARLHPVFRDRDELASSTALSTPLEAALTDSEALIVVCSPAAVASKWVNEEIRYFRQHHPDRSVLAFVVAGDPGIDPRANPALAALPINLALADVNLADGALGEPLAADARSEADGFRAALLKIAAGLLDVRFDDLRQRDFRRRQQRWAIVGAASIVLAAAFAVLAWQATVARDEARRARASAELELQSEQQTRSFLLSVFQLADAGEARGNSVTVREVLDKAVARIDATPFARPAIKSRFLGSMGKAYASLGLNSRSVELLRQSLEVLPAGESAPESWGLRADGEIDLAAVLYDMGDYPAALTALDAVLKADIAVHPLSLVQRAKAANVRGDVLSRTDRADEAKRAYNDALVQIESAAITKEESALIRASSLTGLAFIAFDADDHVAADGLFAQAIDILRPVVGDSHPLTNAANISRAANAYARGDYPTALDAWRRALTVAQQLYDPDHPQIGTLKNNLGRLLLETGDLPEAEELLRAALKSDRMHRSKEFDDLAFSLHNLAYVRWARGDAAEARTLLEEALPIAEESKHRMLGPILNALADVDCSGGEADNGSKLAERALAVNSEKSGADHWTSKQAALTLEYCRAMAGGTTNRASLDALVAAIKTRWTAKSAFTLRAEAQRQAITKIAAR